jgi:hypothetical protein
MAGVRPQDHVVKRVEYAGLSTPGTKTQEAPTRGASNLSVLCCYRL